MRILYSLLILLFLSSPAYGFCPPGGGNPDFNTISGIVKNSEGNPIYRLKVRIKDTNMFYITDEKGFFIFPNVNKETVTLIFDYEDKFPELDLGTIGMKKVIFIEDITLTNSIPRIRKIHSKDSRDLSGMTAKDLAAFQFADASIEDQVKAFLGVRKK